MHPSNLSKFILALVASTGVETAVALADCAIPNQIENGQAADSTPVNGNFSALGSCVTAASPAGEANSVQLKSPNGGLAGSSPLQNGQLLIGATGGAPQAANISAGQGVTVQSAPGGITVSASGGTPVDPGIDWLNTSAVIRPSSGSFALKTSTVPPTTAAIVPTVRGFAITAASSPANTAMVAETNAPNGPWQATMLTAYSGPLSSYSVPAIVVRDSVNNRAVEFGIGGSTTSYRFSYMKSVGGSGFDRFIGTTVSFQELGLPPPAEPLWSRLTYDGTSLIWAFSRDGEFFVDAYSAAAEESLTHLDKVGPGVLFVESALPALPVAYHVLSWKLTSL